MKLWPFSRAESKALTINQVIDRIEALAMAKSGVSVTPENCERAPTVKAIVTAISRRVSVSPVSVLQKVTEGGRSAKIPQPNHPISILLQKPNEWQNRVTFWLDMGSQLVRYGNCYAWKGGGRSGPVRRLVPLNAGETRAEFNENNVVTYNSTDGSSRPRSYGADEIWHARGVSRDFLTGDSPIVDVHEAIALEIAAEEFGATFFGNGAVPMLVFQFLEGFKDWKDEAERNRFIDDVKQKLTGAKRHRAFLLPKGVELADKNRYTFDLDKAQFVDARRYQRTVIAGAFGVPPNYVGDLERATYNNVEQQTIGFTTDVILPYVRMLESSLEDDLLTPEEIQQGFIIRFNLSATQRADFKSRQEGLQIQRLNGIINANEWREHENMNPLEGDDEGGENYWQPANYTLPGASEDDDETPPDDEANDNAN